MTDQLQADPTRRAGLPQLVVLLAGSCLAVLGAVSISPVLPEMERVFATTPGVHVLVPVVLTIPALMIGLTAPFAGQYIDRVDRTRLLVVALVAYAVCGTAPLYLDSLVAIVATRVLVGLCEAAILTCCTTLIGDYWDGEQRARYLGLQTLVAALAAVVFLGLGGLLGSVGWRTPFWLYLIAALLALPMARLIWAPQPDADRSATGTRLESMPWRTLAGPAAVTLVGGVVFYALIVQLSFVLDHAGVKSTALIGGVAALMSLATAAGSVVFGRLTHRTHDQLLPADFAIAALGLLTVAATGSPVVIAVGAVVTGLGTGLLLPSLLTWFVGLLTFTQRGRGIGLFTGTLFIGEFVSPLVIAAVGAGLGGLRPALALLALGCLVMAVTAKRSLRAAGPITVPVPAATMPAGGPVDGFVV